MKEIKINGSTYILEYTFEAAMNKNLIQRFFNILSGSYFLRNIETSKDENVNQVVTMFEGLADMSSDIPKITEEAFYAGLLEHQDDIDEKGAKKLMKEYLKESGLSFKGLYDEIQEIMGDDGFFDKSGLTEMLKTFAENSEAMTKPTPMKRKKSTSSK